MRISSRLAFMIPKSIYPDFWMSVNSSRLKSNETWLQKAKEVPICKVSSGDQTSYYYKDLNIICRHWSQVRYHVTIRGHSSVHL